MIDDRKERHMGIAPTASGYGEIHILWVSPGASCDGDAESLSHVSPPSVEDVISEANSGLPKIRLHSTMPVHEADGDSTNAFHRAARGELGPFLLVVEGPIPGGRIGDEGSRTSMGTDPGEPSTSTEWIDRLAPRAWAVVAAGACATHGDTHTMADNSTGCRRLADRLGGDFRSAGDLPIVTVPGNPIGPDDLGKTLLWVVHRAAGQAVPLSPDDRRRPARLLGRAVGEQHPNGALAAAADFERMRAVADAILYEGYLLYPYRKSSPKNRVRWQFGVLAPRSWVESHGPVAPTVAGSAESWRQQTECLLEASHDARDVTVHVRVRFLQLQAKSVERREVDGRYEPVESLEVDGTTHLAFDEAVPRESDIAVDLADLLDADRAFAVWVPGGEEVEQLGDGSGRVIRRRRPVSAMTTLRAQRIDTPVTTYRLRVSTENTGPAITPDTSRNEALRHSLIATHTFLGGCGLEFHSLIEPAEWAAPYARACHNIHTFPVLAGDSGTRDLMLSSPILLYDHPRIAPESPGDLHDAAEIDEILSLRTLTLTDEEKREARATDPRAAEILDRVEGMPQEVMARLHGAVRSLRPDPTAEKTTEGGV
ncbi:NADH ubiquinone oxidoreductase subunit [Halopolyspora algeriensis]|uniref:NADH ubiquinone oxidoreductase subunit n=1 Tax=Halopolyspora algeriensis TaxID=1500506 RepID=A0A368VVG7_9ACTN|nr:hypothetical protein [Halopolyspora algeriensis]RCW44648.1 NADH ubiquinone oxidoreductase subunit [Halopolyspora algeriensis]TQM56009.1 NADH ubiquinone oxidoreductase subunit [Halopolyspora algeriensis]